MNQIITKPRGPAPSVRALTTSERRLEQAGEGHPMHSEQRRFSRHHPDKP